jgi:hypothetical protein
LAPFDPILCGSTPWAGTPSPPLESGGEVLWIAVCAKSEPFDPRVYWALEHQAIPG